MFLVKVNMSFWQEPFWSTLLSSDTVGNFELTWVRNWRTLTASRMGWHPRSAVQNWGQRNLMGLPNAFLFLNWQKVQFRVENSADIPLSLFYALLSNTLREGSLSPCSAHSRSGWTNGPGNVLHGAMLLSSAPPAAPSVLSLPLDLSLSRSSWHPGTPDLSVASPFSSPSRLGDGSLTSFWYPLHCLGFPR